MTKGPSSNKRKHEGEDDVEESKNLEEEQLEAGPSSVPAKRGPGRPKGSSSKPAVDTSTSILTSPDNEQPVKRGRGRPKKIRTPEEEAALAAKLNKPKGRRGRPPKKKPEDDTGEGSEERGANAEARGAGASSRATGLDSGGGA